MIELIIILNIFLLCIDIVIFGTIALCFNTEIIDVIKDKESRQAVLGFNLLINAIVLINFFFKC